MGHAHGRRRHWWKGRLGAGLPPHSMNKNTMPAKIDRCIPAGSPGRVALAPAVPATVAMCAPSERSARRVRRRCSKGPSARGSVGQGAVASMESSEIFALAIVSFASASQLGKKLNTVVALAQPKRKRQDARRVWRKSKHKQRAWQPHPSVSC